MLEKLRDNPRAVVATLVAAGVLAVAVGASGQNNDSADTDQTEAQTSEIVVDAENGVDVPAENTTSEEAGSTEESVAEMQEPAAGPVEVTSQDGSLSATVRMGDNQTVIIRQMVDDYLSANNDTISEEQKLFVETNAVNNLPRNDIVHAGDEITVDESSLAQLVEDSKQLDESAIARWSAYL